MTHPIKREHLVVIGNGMAGCRAIEDILDETDAVMIARGDLGVEVGAADVPLLQKHIILAALERGKPAITATQMLESMVHRPEPTRAEASDVANAILDGTSAVMLSAETAIGEYPVEAVETMAEIPPRRPGRSHGTNMQEPENARSQGTAIRYITATGMATQRAQRAFLAHRKAKQAGLILPAAEPEAIPANQNCTNDFPALSSPAEAMAPESPKCWGGWPPTA